MYAKTKHFANSALHFGKNCLPLQRYKDIYLSNVRIAWKHSFALIAI